jgi:hypothetical protein
MCEKGDRLKLKELFLFEKATINNSKCNLKYFGKPFIRRIHEFQRRKNKL